MVEASNLNDLKKHFGIKPKHQSCHTGLVGGYFLEGHIPAEDIYRLLKEKPGIRGLSVPGMPAGSPGMESNRPRPYKVLAIDHSGGTTVWARH